ncbi:MAG: tetratricopeptide repeat protein [Myxococcota bacterium]
MTRVLAIAALLPLFASVAAAQGRTRAAARAPLGFQEPAEEQRIEGGADPLGAEEDGARPLPENLESRLYLRERPDALGASALEAVEAQLGALLAEREQLVCERRREAISLLEAFVRDEPETAPEMPDALLRLAELLWEDARAETLVAFAAWNEAPEERRGPAPTPDYRRAVALYDRILERHPDFPRTDLVLYMKAFALVEKDDSVGALALYGRILEEHPESRFVPDAHFARAEARFSVGDWEAARAEYEAVMAAEESQLFPISLFKSAWCLWRAGESEEAALRFRRVLDLGRGGETLSAEQRQRLRELQDEALDYLIQVFVEDETNTARDVFAFLEEIGGERYANRVLVRLADTFQGQARYDRAIEAYGILLERDPTVRDAPKYQREIARSYGQLGDEAATMEALGTLAATYGPGGVWASQQGNPERVEREWRRAEAMIRRQALSWHEIGQTENQRPKLAQAVALYGVYLEHFADREPAYEIEFYRAEINFHRLEAYAEAGDCYLAAAQRNPEGELTKDALYNAIGAFERVREAQLEGCTGDEPEDAGGDEGEVAEASPGDPCRGETSNDRKFGEAIALYVELFPDDPDLPEILFRQGRLYYDRAIYDPAVRLFGQLLERFPESPYAAQAGELILDSFNRAEDYGNIEAWARRLKDAPAFSSRESQARLDGLILQSIFKVGEQLAERGAHAEAADAYLRAAEEFPRDERAKQAFYNAGLERQRAGDLAGAAAAYDRLVEDYAGTREGALGALAGARMYESIAQFGDAARFYEAYGRRFPREPEAESSLYNAVLLRVTNGDYDAAVALGEIYLERHARAEGAGDVVFFVARAHEGNEDWNDAAETYGRYAQRTRNLDRKVEALTRLGQVRLRAGDARNADRAWDEAVRIGKRRRNRLDSGLYYAAQARHLQGEQVLARYEAIAIAGDSAGLRERLQRKSELLRDAAVVFADVVTFNVAEWVTAALYQIGHSYEVFAEAMRAFEVPPELGEAEQQAYLDALATFIVPMEERALEAYEGGYAKALELRIYNRWTALLREGLTRLNDVQYPPIRETGAALVEEIPLPLPAPLSGLQRDTEEEASP